jgi:site-specific DNA-methyltransferase (adenine-specific)
MTLSLFSVGKTARIVHGDSLDVLRQLAPDSLQAMVTDPPAGIGFMSASWDDDKGGRDQWIAWFASVMVHALAALKPGAYALVWALPKTSHWTAMGLENAGFEIHDVHHHIHGEGMPKMGDVGKLIDKHLGAEREVVGHVEKLESFGPNRVYGSGPDHAGVMALTEPATPEAAQWTGWSGQLKPAVEHWILARKPLDGTYAENVLKHGTGVMNIDGCRVGDSKEVPASPKKVGRSLHTVSMPGKGGTSGFDPNIGRWPAHLSLDEAGAALLDEQSGVPDSGARNAGVRQGRRDGKTFGDQRGDGGPAIAPSSGGASRFFYVAKADRDEKTAGGLVDNDHPTPKSIALMTWLVRLITPPGGTVLDPFAGSGTTGLACAAEGFSFIGIEQDPKHHGTARQRLQLAYGSVETAL